ncbi:type 2 periplasmic-binding domain-containing protein [Streptomyces pseudovenezuelae]|uniref:hypothetical protein n=1 Tax=Streptomyces pseudovenezuelae TaxID=67350 RepID=UPI0036EAAAC6
MRPRPSRCRRRPGGLRNADPVFTVDPLLGTIADAPALAALVGELARLLWLSDQDLRRIPVHGPTPVHPHSLIWRSDNSHPSLAALRAHLHATRPEQPGAGTWAPGWAQ